MPRRQCRAALEFGWILRFSSGEERGEGLLELGVLEGEPERLELLWEDSLGREERLIDKLGTERQL